MAAAGAGGTTRAGAVSPGVTAGRRFERRRAASERPGGYAVGASERRRRRDGAADKTRRCPEANPRAPGLPLDWWCGSLVDLRLPAAADHEDVGGAPAQEHADA